ncbi:hypothetical protein GMRT_24240 [Giardia muris]|uniref:Uncharacterized protein n=1 Tax=Giardia muris TaxID=5742 RepID=A0A4Z1SN90_GIAMU|nr:hypothetical protein GMRT_24240 [Giardia muris]|eukprot:TNJ27224.1 hypothetical protein GMRT_24240 [Giardia muris]
MKSFDELRPITDKAEIWPDWTPWRRLPPLTQPRPLRGEEKAALLHELTLAQKRAPGDSEFLAHGALPPALLELYNCYEPRINGKQGCTALKPSFSARSGLRDGREGSGVAPRPQEAQVHVNKPGFQPLSARLSRCSK